MRAFATLDLETDPFSRPNPNEPGRIPEAFSAYVYDGKVVNVYWGKQCVKELIARCRQLKDHIIFAHNGGKFDFHFLLQLLLEIYPYEKLELVCIGPRIVAIKTPEFELRDSFCLIPKKLSQIAGANKKEIEYWKMLDSVLWNDESAIKENELLEFCKHLSTTTARVYVEWPIPENHSYPSPREVFKSEIISYGKQDVIGLYDALKEFFVRYGCEITLASTTFKVLKEKFNVKPGRTDITYDDNFRKFYFAGRVEFFSLGKHGEQDNKIRYRIVDINSAFPYAMLSRHWFGGDYIIRNEIPKVNKEQCAYIVVCDSDGVLPLRAENGSVHFPKVVKTEFHVFGWELFAGIELGKIKNLKIKKIYAPTHLMDFSEYVNHFYEMKRNATNEADRDFAKLFLNSMYGKFALNSREFTDVVITPYGEIPKPKVYDLKKLAKPSEEREEGVSYHKNEKGEWTKEVEWNHSFDDLKRGLSFWQQPSNDIESNVPFTFYNVCTAASITSYVRAFLAKSMAKCSNVLYCDTDSIICSDISGLCLSDDLGAWKLEGECSCVWIGGKKLYVAKYANPKTDKKTGKLIEYKKASKGVRLNVKDLISVCEGEAKTYHFEAPNYSVFSPIRFTSRTIVRDDKRKKR